MPADVLIRGASVHDGSGSPAFVADVAVAGGRIAAIGPRAGAQGARVVIDAAGLALTPGFIDIHSHADFTLSSYPDAVNSISQGVTTEVVGNCGFSPAPVGDEGKAELVRGWGAGLGPDLDWQWAGFGGYLDALEAARPNVNVAALVGHGALRIAAMGMADRAATLPELAAMRRLLADALDAGAWGMSTGLVYPPGAFATTSELLEVGQELRRADALYASHIRSEAGRVVEAVDEVLDIGERLGIRVEVSHLKAIGPPNRGRIGELQAALGAARARGVRATADAYPYNGGSSTLLILLPPWVQEGGIEATLDHLGRQEARDRIRREMNDGLPGWDNELETVGGWSGIFIAGVANPDLRWAQGGRVSELAAASGMDALDFVFDLLIRDRCSTLAIGFGVSVEDNMTAIADPYTSIGSDQAGVVRRDSQVHPRCYGSFTRVLRWAVSDEHLMSPEEAVRKMSGLPASVLGLPDRGLVREGFVADLVLFDPVGVRDNATFEEPGLLSSGVRDVLLGGRFAVRDGVVTDLRGGRVLRRRVPGGA